ncbi:NAD(P)/FAD-dependent oxidoreductase [Sneathiella litorea]|uniref:FAD-dependent oxidoreductase n=1 Tax=Sneathiella litorea TaxID=2606216 RepID=A0A6L8W949_9PROT|nr:FAD-binding oxidoreductase [Sneathiella litorea]MZR31636.1 FAD-dependent oxidoreductase [Sneathiella litorea]
MRIAILGAGIMGSSLAILLARRGANVTLFEGGGAPMMGASRWNEGKIHLGYVYAGDPTLASARHVLSGGISFAPIVSEILQTDIRPYSTTEDDLFVLHQDSVVDKAEFKGFLKKLDEIAGSHPDAGDYFGNLSGYSSLELTTKEIEPIANPETTVSAFRVPERSVQTEVIAGLYCAALGNDKKITLETGCTVTNVSPQDMDNGSWSVTCDTADGKKTFEEFDSVINALWHGRMDIDAKVGIPPSGTWSNRYRVSLFAKTNRVVKTPSAFVAVGAFGDVKNYDDRSFYLSWYPAGLLLDSIDVLPKTPDPLTVEQKNIITENVRSGLATVLIGADEIFDAAQDIRVEGGFVFAQGRGSIAERSSTLHSRDKFGITRKGRYYSIDTGKYSSAPELATILVKELMG